MKFRTGLVATLWAVVVLACGTPAAAQTLDNLECYKSRDPLLVNAVATLDSAEFGLKPGCKIGRTAFICVPAATTLFGSGSTAIDGQPLEDRRICYKIKCPSPSAPDLELADRFGTRVFTGLKTSFLCTPASGTTPLASSTTTTTTAIPQSGLFQNIGTYGVPSNGYPSWQERAAQVCVNAVRMSPLDYRAKYATDTKFSLAAVGALAGYPAVEPVYWVLGLNQAARYHSNDMLQNTCFKHDSCNGMDWTKRVASFYSGGAGGENIAAGMSDPRVLVNAWLCDSTGTACCRDFASCDGHRRNIMTDRFRATGFGYATDGTKHYWTEGPRGRVAADASPDPARRRRPSADRYGEHHVPHELSRRKRRAALGIGRPQRRRAHDDVESRHRYARQLRVRDRTRLRLPLVSLRGRRLGRTQVALSGGGRAPHVRRRCVRAVVRAVAALPLASTHPSVSHHRKIPRTRRCRPSPCSVRDARPVTPQKARTREGC
jgi:uncharacterized protein YkwD